MRVQLLLHLNRMTGTLHAYRAIEAGRRLREVHLDTSSRTLLQERYARGFEIRGCEP